MLTRKSLIACLLLLTATVSPTLTSWEQASSPMGAVVQGKTILQTICSPKTPSEGLRSALSVPKAYALGGGPGIAAAMRSGSSTLENTAQKFLTKGLEVFVVLNWFALMAVQTLLDVDAIFGPPDSSGVRPMEALLNDLWVLSRNIANALFAFILLFGGIYLILKAEGAEPFIKSKLPNFVLAVVLVNFSWFFPRVIIDASNVLTSVIFQLPALVNPNLTCYQSRKPGPNGRLYDADDVLEPCKYVYRVVLFPESRKVCKPPAGVSPHVDCPRPSAAEGKQIDNFVDIYWRDWDDILRNGYSYKVGPSPGTDVHVRPSGADAIINGLAVNFAKIPNLGVIDFQKLVVGNAQQTLAQSAAGFAQFFMHLILHVILSVAMGLALLAFAAVLVVRMGVLWLCIAFMPFIFVPLAMGKPLGDLGQEAGGMNIWKKFLSYALLPALVAIPFSIGFILVSQLYYIQSLPLTANLQNLDFMEGIDDFHHILWMVISVAIIWIGVFKVLESKDDFAKSIVGSIKGIGTTGLRIATQTVGYAPFIPTGKGEERVGLFDLRDKMRGMAAGKGLAPLFRPQEPPLPPPPAQNVTNAVASLPPGQINDLKQALQPLKNVTTHNAEKVLDDLARKLSQINGLGLNYGQARGVVDNREALQNLLNTREGRNGKRVVEDGEVQHLMSKLDEHFGRAAGGTVNIGITVKPGVGGQPEARKEGAGKAHDALTSASHNLEQVKKALDEKAKDATLQPLQQQGFQEVLNKILEVERQGKGPKETRDNVLAELAKMK